VADRFIVVPHHSSDRTGEEKPSVSPAQMMLGWNWTDGSVHSGMNWWNNSMRAFGFWHVSMFGWFK
jgi:hypothetical protein